LKPDIATMSNEIFSLDEPEKRILKYLALYGPMNLSELSQHTSKYAYSLDRWSLKKHLYGSSRFMGLIPYEYVTAISKNKKETKFHLTTKGVLACTVVMSIEKNTYFHQFVKNLTSEYPRKGIKNFIKDFVIVSIHLFVYWHFLNGINISKLKSSEFYILNFFNRMVRTSEIDLTNTQLKDNPHMKKILKKFIIFVTALDLITENKHFPFYTPYSLVLPKKMKKKIVKNTKTFVFGGYLWNWPKQLGESYNEEKDLGTGLGKLYDMYYTVNMIKETNLKLKEIEMEFKWKSKINDPFAEYDKDSWVTLFFEN